jgi:uncharacterized membrane protein YbjE (DUF340 family)
MFNVDITKVFLHNLSQRHVSALSWAVFRLNIFLCEVKRTIDNVMILLSTRSRVTSIKFIYIKLITVIVELKYFHNIKDKKSRVSQTRKGDGGAKIGEFLFFNYVGFFIGYSVVE